jgi:hypothetical protein
VVRPASEQPARKWLYRLLSAATFLIALVGLARSAWPAPPPGSPPSPPILSSTLPLRLGSPLRLRSFAITSSQDRDFDPAAIQFYDALSFSAMSVTAPTIFGDFQSPTGVSYSAFKWRGATTPNITGLDAQAATMVSDIVHQGRNGGALMADAFGVGLGSEGAPNGAGTSSSRSASAFTVGVPTAVPMADPERGEGSVCSNSEFANKLQAGTADYWNGHAAPLAPVQFPQGVFGGGGVEDPLRDLGPTGDPSNVVGPVPGGEWCRPGPVPFSMSSPLEDDVVWILLYVVLGGLIVFWLTRGHRREFVA